MFVFQVTRNKSRKQDSPKAHRDPQLTRSAVLHKVMRRDVKAGLGLTPSSHDGVAPLISAQDSSKRNDTSRKTDEIVLC